MLQGYSIGDKDIKNIKLGILEWKRKSWWNMSRPVLHFLQGLEPPQNRVFSRISSYINWIKKFLKQKLFYTEFSTTFILNHFLGSSFVSKLEYRRILPFSIIERIYLFLTIKCSDFILEKNVSGKKSLLLLSLIHISEPTRPY